MKSILANKNNNKSIISRVAVVTIEAPPHPPCSKSQTRLTSKDLRRRTKVTLAVRVMQDQRLSKMGPGLKQPT